MLPLDLILVSKCRKGKRKGDHTGPGCRAAGSGGDIVPSGLAAVIPVLDISVSHSQHQQWGVTALGCTSALEGFPSTPVILW